MTPSNDPVQIKVVKTGRLRGPDLSDPQLAVIGADMVAAQKLRWSKGIDAEGNTAKKLSIMYFFRKRKHQGGGTPIRDMKLTGQTAANFSLRKASRGIIRAENTSRETRRRALRAQGYDEMIGFAGSDQVTVFKATQLQYGIHVQKAWVPIG